MVPSSSATCLSKSEYGAFYYDMGVGISHDIAFGMCHVGRKGRLHDHVVYRFDHVVDFFKST